MSRQRYKINQLVKVRLKTRYVELSGLGVVQDYAPKEYAGYSVRMICINGHQSHYYYNGSPFNKDGIYRCLPKELKAMYSLSNSHQSISFMKSAVSGIIKSAAHTKSNSKKYNHNNAYCYYTNQFKNQMNNLLWYSFANKRMKNLQVRFDARTQELFIDPTTFTKFPIEREQRRDEYVQ